MKPLKCLNLLALSLFMACSSTPKLADETHQFKPGSRSIAEVDITRGELSAKRVRKTIKKIFHSYLIGQVLLKEFDLKLDQDPTQALESEVYSQLQAVRVSVDAFEEDINDLYVNLVLVSALPRFSDEQKETARQTLNIIGDFLSGVTEDKKVLPENLKHLVLSNLREKQTFLYDELKALSEDSTITQNNPDVIKVIHDNMVLLRATRMKYFKEVKDYQVDEKLLAKTVAEESKDKDFKSYKKDIKKLSKQMRKLSVEARGGRSTSSDVIYPAAGAAGNITGRGFPANTWSITYDDGPGGKTTPVILQNLKDRKMKATFFMLAKQVEGLPNTAKSIAEAGMDIASHSYDHAQLTKVSAANLEKQIAGSKKIIEAKLGKEVKLFRLPYGAGVSVSSIRSKIAANHMIHVFWNVDTLDWQDKNPTSIFNRSLKQMKASAKNSGVILFHDIHKQSVTASTMLMDYLQRNKINVCTVQAVVDQLNQGLATCQK